ncbi:MAG: IclR family transcriptional regulator [Clostridium sp.]|jgi:DNA-binding IclR family transcriptional regulator|uniref:IclR family transcriptional regulator n=1 Tax=Clostridium sp. TaxID=1506 RepID=UPI0025B880E9|nr:IclR family transcriptional regulator [Clostridium sp.]MCH3964923.1 IclR family transcriptional regulator [Clostridium sp.]MCI1716583.1 IclR family transcriptional regulator [Clostridium sp.]MCI1800935.1 IclR family transcriptional regulator [Clostridium sp.]MCI1814760.1 IclR family transcriptional regulator [Clostridium sp.]MCI1871682.1 IclR family transcriptional regulator [Clostridium sp.]
MNNNSENSSLVQSVNKALEILNALAECPKGCRIAELSKRLGLNKSTIYRILATLRYRNYVIKNEENDKYMLGTQILYLSQSLKSGMDLVTISRPYINKLVDKIGETAHLCIPDELFHNIIYIDKISPEQPNRSIYMSSKIGKKTPIYCTASGKLLLSQFSDEKIKNILEKIDLVKHTENTIIDVNIFLDEIKKIRIDRYALDRVENENGIICIAVPIFNSKGEICATISISSVILFKTIEDLLSYKDDIFEICNKISKLLGFMS